MFGIGTLGVGPDAATASIAVAPKPTVWDNINNVLTKVVQPAANVYTQIKTNQQQPSGSTVPGYTPGYVPPVPAAPAPAPVDNTKKYLLIGGAVILAGGALYLVTRKKK